MEIPGSVTHRKIELSASVLINSPEGVKSLPEETAILNVVKKNVLVFVQTDKPVYKPGQTGIVLMNKPLIHIAFKFRSSFYTYIEIVRDSNRKKQWNYDKEFSNHASNIGFPTSQILLISNVIFLKQTTDEK